MKKEVAETICGMVDDVLGKLQDFNNYINENSDAVPIERIRSAVAELDVKILDPIYRQFPQLKPPTLP
jgi:phage-related protein